MYKLITTKTVFIISLFVAAITILLTWLIGIEVHRSLLANSLLSTTILSLGFFSFIVWGLYNGFKLKDNLGKIAKTPNLKSIPSFPDLPIGEIPSGGVGEEILAVILWIAISVILIILLWYFGAILWSGILLFVATLYWIFFRALRVVFKNSKKCKGNLRLSFITGFTYTVLYNFWIYGVIFLLHLL